MIVLLLMGLTIIVLLIAGLPIALVLGLSGIVWTAAFEMRYLPGIAYTIYNTATSDTLVAVPLFIMMGQIVQHSNIARRFYDSVAILLQRVPGGLLHANVSVCAVFSAVSGSSVATAATVASAALPNLRRMKYNMRLATGSLAAGGTLGILIPPSIPLIVYGSMVEESIGDLYAAALLPSLLVVVMFHLYIVVHAVLREPRVVDERERQPVTAQAVFNMLRDLLPIAVIVVVVLGGIYSGITTASEAAAAGVAMCLVVALAYGQFSFATLRAVMVQTVIFTSMIMFIVIGAQIFSFAIYTWGINRELAAFVSGLDYPPIVIFSLIALVYLILGTFIEELSMMLMSLAVVHPIIVAIGYDPVWFGIVLVIILEIGLISPPVGMNLFTIQAIDREVTLGEVSIGALPFVVMMLLTVVILVAFPQVALWLPAYLR